MAKANDANRIALKKTKDTKGTIVVGGDCPAGNVQFYFPRWLLDKAGVNPDKATGRLTWKENKIILVLE